MKFRISDLKNFLETSSSPTIVQAAKKLQISQPALSESLKRLEGDLGSLLFYRSRQGIRLTPSGRIFLDKVRKVTHALEDLEEAKSANTSFENRIITIGCHPVVAQYCLPKALAFLQAQAPDYKVNLQHGLSRTMLSEIQLGNIDIGVVINPAPLPDLVLREVAQDVIGVWTAKGGKNIDKGGKNFETVICEQDLYQTQSILKRWKQKPEKLIQTSSIELMCHLVAEGIGCGIIPERAVKLSGFDLKMSTQLPTFQDKIHIAHRPEFGKSPAEKLMIEALKESFK